VVSTCSVNLQKVQAVEVSEGVLADAGDFIGIQQSEKTIHNTHIVNLMFVVLYILVTYRVFHDFMA
jgi:hypothetical protein